MARWMTPTPEQEASLAAKSESQTTEPCIWITVTRSINGHPINSMRQISFELWREGKFNGRMFDVEVNAMMKEVHYGK